MSQLSPKALGLTIGVFFGGIIFIATNWLVLKGGHEVGLHLQLLGQFFIGYRVSFLGSIIGLIYGFVAGYICGAFIGWLYNIILTSTKK